MGRTAGCGYVGHALQLFSQSSPSASSGAVVIIQFTHDVEVEAASGYPGGPAEVLDDGLSMASPNEDGDGSFNTLKPDISSSVQERGVTLDVNSNTVNISWNPSAGLRIIDAGDRVTSVTYSGLNSVLVQESEKPSTSQTLAALLSMSTITCTPD